MDPSMNKNYKTTQETFLIEKVIRRDHKKKLALVKWKGYPTTFSWIPIKDVNDIWPMTTQYIQSTAVDVLGVEAHTIADAY